MVSVRELSRKKSCQSLHLSRSFIPCLVCIGVSRSPHLQSSAPWLRCPASSQRTLSVSFCAKRAASTASSLPFSLVSRRSPAEMTLTRSTTARRLTRLRRIRATQLSGSASLLVSPMSSVESVSAFSGPQPLLWHLRTAQPSLACSLSLSSPPLSASTQWSLESLSTLSPVDGVEVWVKNQVFVPQKYPYWQDLQASYHNLLYDIKTYFKSESIILRPSDLFIFAECLFAFSIFRSFFYHAIIPSIQENKISLTLALNK